MGLIKRALIIAFLAWLLVRIIVLTKLIHTFRIGIPVFNHQPGPCKLFHVNGSEDMDMLPNGLAIFSSGVYYHISPMGVDPSMKHFKGMLYSFNMNDPDAKPKPVSYENFDDTGFQPHGIDFYTDPKTQEISLFVINHARGINTVEIFHVDPKNVVLKHMKTIFDEKIISPNDILATGPESFYITNDRYFRSTLLSLVEGFYPLKLGTVVFYDGSRARFATDHQFQFPNGINFDPTGRFVFVADTLAGQVVVFEPNGEGDLIKRQSLEIGVMLDNIDVDDDGHLWIGVANFAMMEYNANFTKPCPGSLLQVKLSKLENGIVPFRVDEIREVFSHSGEGDFKCVSTALFHREKLLIGTPFSNAMYCDVLAF